MTTGTYSYNVRTSWHKLLKAKALTIQGEINALLGTSHTLAYYAQKQPETFPSLRSWVYLRDDPNAARHRLEDMIQLDIFIKSASASTPDVRLIELIQGKLRHHLDLRTQRNAFYAYFTVLDYAAGTRAPIGNCRIESKGWHDRPDEDPLVTRWQADFKLIHK